MFEVEQKFTLTEAQKQTLLTGATFVREQRIVDAYYDTVEYLLTSKNYWLRKRDTGFELKVGVRVEAGPHVKTFREIEDEGEIRALLNLPATDDMDTVLAAQGYQVFCACETFRRTYEKDGFTIVLDEVTYPGYAFVHRVCEIELLVEAAEQMPEAASRVLAFAAAQGLTSERVLGKVIAFLHRESPSHLAALVAAGAVRRVD